MEVRLRHAMDRIGHPGYLYTSCCVVYLYSIDQLPNDPRKSTNCGRGISQFIISEEDIDFSYLADSSR